MITLPDLSQYPIEPEPAAISNAIDQTSPLNGARQRVVRPGGMFELSVALPALGYDDAQAWVGDLIAALEEEAEIVFPQPRRLAVEGGTAQVHGSGQVGSSLAVTTTPTHASATIRKGQFLSVTAGGRRYLYVARANATAVDQSLVIPIWPMLRASPAGGSDVELSTPLIQGMVEGNRREWKVDLVAAVGANFTLREVR